MRASTSKLTQLHQDRRYVEQGDPSTSLPKLSSPPPHLNLGNKQLGRNSSHLKLLLPNVTILEHSASPAATHDEQKEETQEDDPGPFFFDNSILRTTNDSDLNKFNEHNTSASMLLQSPTSISSKQASPRKTPETSSGKIVRIAVLSPALAPMSSRAIPTKKK